MARKTVLGLAGALIVLLVLLMSNGQASNTVNTDGWIANGSSAAPSSGVTGASARVSVKVVVHVVGEVATPGVYELSANSRVLDAVFAAGGFKSDADQTSINLARPLTDGEQLVVKKIGESSAAGAVGGLVNINLTDAAGLDSLPGIGPTLAQRIVDFRTSNGGFRAISDLGRVAGIGPMLLSRLKPLVTL